jgi:Pyridoxal-phosphate dependent enzyme
MTITRDDVEDAAGWLSGQVVRTPVVRVASLDRVAGARIWLKAENLQTSGAYKARGALRAVGQVATESCTGGVIAQSTGNHALAVAMAAVDDTPEASQNACFTAARNLPWVARRNRQILIGALASLAPPDDPGGAGAASTAAPAPSGLLPVDAGQRGRGDLAHHD